MDIFIININALENISNELLEEFAYKKISNKKKWQIHAFSYLMLDRILKEVYKIENRSVCFRDRKPVLESSLKHFSISHSGDYVALAFSDNNCGIDIEKNKNRDFLNIAKRMNFKSSNLQDFYIDWTFFEAEYKLGSKSFATKTFLLENYTLTAVSNNQNERFEVFYC